MGRAKIGPTSLFVAGEGKLARLGMGVGHAEPCGT